MEAYQHGIPARYQKVEYIKLIGNAYIDTGVILTPTSRIQMDCQLAEIGMNQCLFCCRAKEETNDIASNSFFVIGNTFRRDFYGDSKTVSSPAPTMSRMILDVNGEKLTMGDLAISSIIPSAPGKAPMTCLLFGSAGYYSEGLSTVSNFARIKIYSCKIWNEGILVRNFIPCCVRNSTTQSGLFDTVTGTFFFSRLLSHKEYLEGPDFIKREKTKSYISIKRQVPDYTNAKMYLTKSNLSMFFDIKQTNNIWEFENHEQIQSDVVIEPTGAYGKIEIGEATTSLELTPLVDLEEIHIILSPYDTETASNKIYFSYNHAIDPSINGLNGASSAEIKVILSDVKKGDKLQFWYEKGPYKCWSEKVQFNLVLVEPYIVKIETGTSHIEKASTEIKKIYISKNNSLKFCDIGYIGYQNVSKIFLSQRFFLSDINIGGVLRVPVIDNYQSRLGRYISFKVADIRHGGYPLDSVTLITEKIIQLMPLDGIEANNSDAIRKVYGNNRYLYSNLLQWLNSNATAGNWYSAQHEADAPPTKPNVKNNYNSYDTWAGFLAMLDPKFVVKLLDTEYETLIPNGDPPVASGIYKDIIVSKIFLPSSTEVGTSSIYKEGTQLPLFKGDASRLAYPTEECVSNSEYKNSGKFASTIPWYWWLRTPYNEEKDYNSNIFSDGTEHGGRPYTNDIGIRPLCNLPGSTLVKQQSDGTYTLV